MPNYLERITQLLGAGLSRLPDETRSRHTSFLRTAQNADGGFSGREGASDLYYTGFAIRGLALLGALDGETAERAARFLENKLADHAPIIDLLSLIYGAEMLKLSSGLDPFARADRQWQAAVGETLESYRRDDGGYAKTPKSTMSSTYYTFLVALCYQLIGRPLTDSAQVVKFLLSRRREEGGFVEIGVAGRSATNPTAAAVSLLKILDALDADVRRDAVRFLSQMQTDEGGLRANTRIPVADLLSTFTGLLTLAEVEALEEIDIPAAERYAYSLERSAGGFGAAVWDEASDVEYTFYGLGTVALVARNSD